MIQHPAKELAILIPCYNESATIAKVIADCKRYLPQAKIYVYDNHSEDDSVSIAENAHVIVRHVAQRGKGHVVKRMFADIDADYYLLVDGDHTYDLSCAETAIKKLADDHLDMLVCTRMPNQKSAFRPGHAIGNKLFTATVNYLFAHQFTDIFSGYRIFSRRFVKSFPAISHGFEIEAEMTIHALQLGLPCDEIPTDYQERPLGSFSKLHTIKDGLRILKTILLLFIYIRPMRMFGGLFLLCAISSLLLGLPIILHYLQTGLVPRMPTAILAATLGLLASFSLACGIILDSVSRSRLETKRYWYLFASQQMDIHA